MKPSEVIDKALTDYIPDAAHWTRGAFRAVGGEDEQFCMLGAIGMAQSEHALVPELAYGGKAYVAIKEVVGELTGGDCGCVGEFNDTIAKDYDEVRAVMEKARASLQERGE
jgi:hypothetical protein